MDSYKIRCYAYDALQFFIVAILAVIVLAGILSLLWLGFTVVIPAEMNKEYPIAYWGLWPIPAWILFISAVMAYSQWEELSLGLAKFLFFLINATILYVIIKVLMFVF